LIAKLVRCKGGSSAAQQHNGGDCERLFDAEAVKAIPAHQHIGNCKADDRARYRQKSGCSFAVNV
jgi:hypothetical protein